MGVSETTTYTLVCDRCGYKQESDLSPATVDMSTWQYWSRRGAEGPWPTTQRLLCGTCAGKLDAFLMGTKTPRGARFNTDEHERYYEGQPVPVDEDILRQVRGY